MNDEHFIKNIEIKNFKLFKDFKAEGFGRVNLIGGKNNVGKTAFMEACYLSQSENTQSLFARLLEIASHRDIVNRLLSRTTIDEDIKELINSEYIMILINKKRVAFYKDVNNKGIYVIETPYFDYLSYTDLSDIINFFIKNTKYNFTINFISPYSNSNQELEDIIGQSKLDNKYDELNKYLLGTFGIESIDIIKNKPMLKDGNKYKELSYYGQGIKTFINLISSILLLKDDIIFIDEIDNGIHYSNLDKLWEIILTISKQQNVQVFATTHSKECIESYARVAKRLEDEEITFVELGKNKDNEIKAMVYPYEWFIDEIEQNHEVRGW
jgi:AAA15 family ATPase/GTPase